MKTQFFLNTIDRDYFKKITSDKLTAAPIDEKNITTDWIDSLFDNETYAYQNGEWLGWIDNVPVRVTYTGNTARFTNLNSERDLYDAATMVDTILQEGEDDNITAIIYHDDEFGYFEVSFYFETDPE